MRAKVRVKHKTKTVPIKLPRNHIIYINGLAMQPAKFWDYEGDYRYFRDSNQLWFRENLEPGDVLRIFGEEDDPS